MERQNRIQGHGLDMLRRVNLVRHTSVHIVSQIVMQDFTRLFTLPDKIGERRDALLA